MTSATLSGTKKKNENKQNKKITYTIYLSCFRREVERRVRMKKLPPILPFARFLSSCLNSKASSLYDFWHTRLDKQTLNLIYYLINPFQLSHIPLFLVAPRNVLTSRLSFLVFFLFFVVFLYVLFYTGEMYHEDDESCSTDSSRHTG